MFCLASAGASEESPIRPGDRISIVGNTFAERMQLDGQFESALHAAFPSHDLSIRNFGWSGDEVALQPRPYKFIGMEEWLNRHETDVVIACFGMNESFSGYEGLAVFQRDLEAWLDTQLAARYNGETPPRVILVSPIAHEDLGSPLPDGEDHNFILDRYVQIMRRVARKKGVYFIDLFGPTRDAMKVCTEPMTINGIHMNESGYRFVTCEMLAELDMPIQSQDAISSEAAANHEVLRQAVLSKNRLFFQRWRPLNTEYVYGRRHEPFGSKNFPEEMAKLDEMIEAAEKKIWSLPPGQAGCLSIEVGYR